MHLSSLIELGLVLFLMTFILERPRSPAHCRDRARRRPCRHERPPSLLAQIPEHRDAHAYGPGRLCRRFRAVHDPWLSGLEGREVAQLEFLHQASRARRRNGRRRGQRHPRQHEAAFPGSCDGTSDWTGGGSLFGRIRRKGVFLRHPLHHRLAQRGAFHRHRHLRGRPCSSFRSTISPRLLAAWLSLS